MLTLALDTAVRRASVVLADDDRELASWRADTHQDLCRRLAPEISDLIERAGRTFPDIDLIAVGLGPGFFTSLRVGLATAKAIALSLDRPLVGVSSLAAMAWHARDRLAGLVCPMLDARRGEVYAAIYRASPHRVEQVEPEFVADPSGLGQRLRPHEESVHLFGQMDAIPVDRIVEAVGPRACPHRREAVLPDALAVAQLSRRRYTRQGGDDPAPLRPIYVRKSYAEERFDIDLGMR